tara:strand:+ start:253 stop:756 length:504 start_codon:yes stop_codon:yes gene_type:complete
MAFLKEPNFNVPIPGQGLTSEPGSRPWQGPPELTTVEEGAEFYLSRIAEPKMAARLLDIVERGIPITAIAETMTMAGVMQGMHSVDVAVLVNPILVELMEGLAKNLNVKYKLGDTDNEDAPDEYVLSKVMANLKEIDEEEIEEEMVDLKKEKEEMKSKGLMSRKGAM